ncbi:MAG: hypothetical protein ABH821_05370 [archaeon]
MIETTFTVLGAIGLILISIGVIRKKGQDYLFIAGGTLVFVYSIYVQNAIFAVLQVVFVLAAVYDLLVRKGRKRITGE